MNDIQFRLFTFKRIEAFVFYSLLCLYAVLPWLFRHFLTMDGPTHLYSAKVFLNLLSGEDNIFKSFFEINSGLTTNWFNTLALSALLSLFPPFIAEKIFLSTYFICLPLIFRRVIRQINPSSIYLSSLIFIFIYNRFSLFGLYNFQWSLVWILLFIGVYLKGAEKLSLTRYLLLQFICLLAVLTHPVSLLFIYSFIGFELVNQLFLRIKEEGAGFKSGIFRQFLFLFTLVIPSLTLLTIYFISRPGGGSIIEFSQTGLRILVLTACSMVASFSRIEQFFILPVCAFFLFFLIFFIKKLRNKHSVNIHIPLTGTLLIALIIIFCIKEQFAGGGDLKTRTNIVFYILFILWIAYFDLSENLKKMSLVAALVGSLGLFGYRFNYFQKMSYLTADFLRARNHITENAITLPVILDTHGTYNGKKVSAILDVFAHLGSYLGVYNGMFVLDDFNSTTGLFPSRWKPNVNPEKLLYKRDNIDLEHRWETFKISEYNQMTPVTITHVVVWGKYDDYYDSPDYQFIEPQLKEEYQLIHNDETLRIYKFRKQGSSQYLNPFNE